MSQFLDDTIAAIATPLGEGGLAVIRLSGAEALAIAGHCFQPHRETGKRPSEMTSHTVALGKIVRDGRTVDEVMLTIMRAPKSFTCEHVVEISCHGGLLAAKTVLDTVLAHGARLALPGEFTKRAFLNGRIDLTQAEAVADIISARTELALAAANEQLAGKLARRIQQLRDEMMSILAHIEAHIDFPEEDISPDTHDALIARLEQALVFMGELSRTAKEGQILRRGIRTAIIGPPNAGKSSLLNQLLGHERAIVSALPGTTRDTIEETANIRGLPIVFIDTAGLRESDDPLEQEGMRRSRETLARADLVLHLLDHAEPWTDRQAEQLIVSEDRKRLLIRNKIDLPQRLQLPADFRFPILAVSCLTGEGIERLKDTIKETVWSGDIKPEMLEVMVNSRHQDALARASRAAILTLESLREGRSLELVALDLRIAVNAVGEIVGKTATEDLLDKIFSQFCLGK